MTALRASWCAAPPVPDLAGYDVILINISGGKDSQAALDETVRAADAAGVRDRIVTVFCDLGDEDEWPGTRELAAGSGVDRVSAACSMAAIMARSVPVSRSARTSASSVQVSLLSESPH